MKWQEVRQQYPETWVIIEALQAHAKNNKKIIDDISVLEQFKNVMDAMKHYKSLHKSNPQRDILVANTENQELDIKVQHWFGVLGSNFLIETRAVIDFCDLSIREHVTQK